jgi:transglutaminase-like putative cysteine protease
MQIRYGFRLSFDVPQPTAVLARLDIHPDRRADILSETPLLFNGGPVPAPITDVHGNLCRRLIAPPGRSELEISGVIGDPGTHEAQMSAEPIVPVAQLPDDALLYLLASRYCEADSLGNLAWQLFGHLPSDATRVRAVVDHVHNSITFGYQFARPTRTAQEALNERVGVCRDFAHATIALCRALNIPARYINGFLGDIGVPRDPAAMDFSAWVEVLVGGRWFTVDARHNSPRIGRIVVARGRDAADVPLIHSFGPHILQDFTVVTEETGPAAGTSEAHQIAA